MQSCIKCANIEKFAVVKISGSELLLPLTFLKTVSDLPVSWFKSCSIKKKKNLHTNENKKKHSSHLIQSFVVNASCVRDLLKHKDKMDRLNCLG